MSWNLLQNLGKCRLVDLNKLLQLVQVVAEEAETLIESDKAGRKLGGVSATSLQSPLLVQ